MTNRVPSTATILLCVVVAGCGARRLQSPNPYVSPEPSPVHLTFRAASDSFAAARDDYDALWTKEAARIVRVMEQVSGLRFDSPPYADTLISAVIFEGVSNSGYREKPMQLRASYPPATKKATLVHELGHRLQVGIARPGEGEHQVLFLWLYDAWIALWGKQFADDQVIVERARHGPYPAAWDAALSLDSASRARRWRALRDRPTTGRPP